MNANTSPQGAIDDAAVRRAHLDAFEGAIARELPQNRAALRASYRPEIHATHLAEMLVDGSPEDGDGDEAWHEALAHYGVAVDHAHQLAESKASSWADAQNLGVPWWQWMLWQHGVHSDDLGEDLAKSDLLPSIVPRPLGPPQQEFVDAVLRGAFEHGALGPNVARMAFGDVAPWSPAEGTVAPKSGDMLVGLSGDRTNDRRALLRLMARSMLERHLGDVRERFNGAMRSYMADRRPLDDWSYLRTAPLDPRASNDYADELAWVLSRAFLSADPEPGPPHANVVVMASRALGAPPIVHPKEFGYR